MNFLKGGYYESEKNIWVNNNYNLPFYNHDNINIFGYGPTISNQMAAGFLLAVLLIYLSNGETLS
jgi:hypothetical protein